MRPPGIEAVERAISLISESRFSHERALYEPAEQVTGSPAFHRQCVEEYDEVLVVLRQTLAMLKADNTAKRIRRAGSIPPNRVEED